MFVLGDREVAGDTDFRTLLLEQMSESSVVNAVALDHRYGCGFAVSYPNRRIIFGNMSEGGSLKGKGLVLVPVLHEMFVTFGSHGFPNHRMTDAGWTNLFF